MAKIPLSEGETQRLKASLDLLAPQIAQAVAAYQRMAPQIQQAVDLFTPVLSQLQQTAGMFQKEAAEAAQKAMQWYQQQLRQLAPVLERIGKEYATLERSTDRAAVPILKRRRWFGLERYFSPWEFQGLIAAYHRGKAKGADKYVCERFSRDRFRRLRSVTKDWWQVAYMRKRKPKVRLALKAYRNREYALVVPTLLTFADGLAHAYFRANPSKLPPTKSGKNPSVLVPQAASRHVPTRPDYAGLLTVAIAATLYKSYRFGVDRAPLAVNRHGVLHGDTLGYDTEANALRTILLLDSICRVALAGPVVP